MIAEAGFFRKIRTILQYAAGLHQRLLQRFEVRLRGSSHHGGRRLYHGHHDAFGSGAERRLPEKAGTLRRKWLQIMETILELKDVKKNYGKKEILKGINLTVQEGEIISVLGPSGCGKSTLLNIIAGILPLNAGQVFVRGKEMSSPHRVVPIEQRDMNMVFQDFALWPHMKARDNIIYGLKVRKTDKAQMQEKLHEVETLLHLDVQLRIEMRTEMAQLFRQLKTTVFHVTHDPSEAFAMADRIIVMNQGVIDQIATPAECYESPRTITVAGLLGAGNCVHGAVMEGPAEADDAEVGSAEQAADGSDRENRAVVSVQNRKLVCKSFQNVKKGQKMLLKFRPEECIFVEKECKNAIPVRVVMSSFEGGQYRVKVETDGGDTFCLLHPTFLKEKQTGYAQILPERLYAYEEISG